MTAADGSDIGSACVNENDFPLRVGSRSRRFLLTGHKNGTVQVRNLQIGARLGPRVC